MKFFLSRVDTMLHFSAAQLWQVMYVHNTVDGGLGRESNKICPGAKNTIQGKCLLLIIIITPSVCQRRAHFLTQSYYILFKLAKSRGTKLRLPKSLLKGKSYLVFHTFYFFFSFSVKGIIIICKAFQFMLPSP